MSQSNQPAVPDTRRLHSPAPARVPGIIEKWSVTAYLVSLGLLTLLVGGLTVWNRWAALGLVVVVPYAWLGISDILQTQHTIRRNFPVLGRLRYVLESIRPEIRQYFVESDSEENPFSREKRSIIYQRAKGQLDTMPFGTMRDVNRVGYEWINHSIAARNARSEEARIPIGGANCSRPYRSSLLNVSGMSYGALSRNAILALNKGAQTGRFSHNTGEGGISPYHLEPGGDLVWQVGTGYFGCRASDGGFDPDKFAETASIDAVKMIELKLSQGAKPGHGGILPAAKVTPEIARIRGVEPGVSVHSPPAHTAFSTPIELLEFIRQMRKLSGGKPIGFKLCLGSRREFLGLCKAMLETGITPDFITVDGAEGGTGAAPLEFANSVGVPLDNGLMYIHRALVGVGLRDRVKLIAAGKITTGFHILRLLALGADLVNAARPMMFALGCIQALKCNTNHCPVGVATQDPRLEKGLVVGDKAKRVHQFHAKTVASAYELLGAAGLEHPKDLQPYHIYRRVSPTDVRSFADIYPLLQRESLVDGEAPSDWMRLWNLASADRF